MIVNNKADHTLKKGTLCLNIPPEYQKTGRIFELTALDKYGKCHTFKDVDNDPAKITGNIEVEGYAFDLTYKD